MKKHEIKLAIAPIGWSNDDMPELGAHISFEQCIQEMAMAGYQGCEVGHKFPRDPQQLKLALSSHQLNVASAWYSLYFTEDGRREETIAGFIQHMNFLKSMGTKVIVICECGHSIQGKSEPIFENKPVFSDKQWVDLFNGLEHIGRLANENHMLIVYHHHMGTGVQFKADIDYLMANTNPEFVSLLLDTGHLTYAGDDPMITLKKHITRIKHVHLKDIRSDVLLHVKDNSLSFLDAVKAGVFTVPGDGSIDFDSILKTLLDLNYKGWWVVEAEQDPEKAHPLTYARNAHQYLSDWLLRYNLS